MSNYVLGLDIGAKSLGWAVIDNTNIVDIGVRVFPEGVDRDTKGAEKSKNAKRREARGTRRIKWRRQMRKDKLIRLLRENKTLPESDTELEKLFTDKDPYQFRAKALDEKIELFEFGRILFHLNQRRGFKSNRKTGKANEDGKVQKQASQLQQDIEDANCRTIGEYFAKSDTLQQRIRDRYTFRSMYENEFDLIWEKQKSFYGDIFTDELKKQLKDETIFFQRPLKPSDKIGNCQLEEAQPRCPKGDYYARMFRILQDVNNLKIQNSDGTEQPLTPSQRETLLKELGTKKEIKWDTVRKKLGLIESQKFNLEQNGKSKSIKGDIFASVVSKIKIIKWKDFTEQQKYEFNKAILELDDDELIECLKNEYQLDDKAIEKIIKIPLPQKYMSFSQKAIKKLLPFMEQGQLTHEAIKSAGYERGNLSNAKIEELLPLPQDLRNPLVNKALHEVRKVVNAIIKEYGKPTKIKMEMAREVKGSAKEREDMHFKMLKNQKRNDEARQELISELDIINPSRDDVIKYKLWKECGIKCPYTGKIITQNALFGANPEFQIEHILPYSRSLDDSYMNKTLCWIDENRHKGEKIPFEYYDGKPQFEEIQQRIAILPYPKRRKFWQKEIELDECIQRELNDTRYICKAVIAYIEQIGVKVQGTKGKITSELRHSWGLNNILDYTGAGLKNRDDHRHHAVDAVVTAVTKNEHLRKLAHTKYATNDKTFPLPWDGFREETTEKINQIIVSHRVTKRVRGQLHEETSYGITGGKDDKGQDIFVYRKKLEDLTMAMIDKIVDPVIKILIVARLKEFGLDPAKKTKIGKEVWAKLLYMPCNKKDANGNIKKIPIKKVRICDVFNNMIPIKDKNGKAYRAVAPGSNHHIEIFEYKDKKGNIKKDAKVVTLFEATRRKKNNESIIKKDYGDGKTFVFSLAQNEMFMLKVDEDNFLPHRVQKFDQNGNIALRPHTFAGQVKDGDLPPIIQRKSPNTLDGLKIQVDVLGRIYPAND
ncbi:MAG: type II CRISPR RNA-guided endonuclease Cas9 [Anaerohalosphaeraceae bacterium]|nr:type II CRISPR RNA-guided endonuclease Cas9 [Anaerohalosphaeraceae bacterium]